MDGEDKIERYEKVGGGMDGQEGGGDSEHRS
jgi:hypothetical protein